MRLVKTPTKKLSEEHTARLMDMVKQSAAKDQKFFEICEYNRKLLRGAHWQKGKPSMNEVVINLAHAHARTMLPTLFFQDPYAEMEPVSPGHEESAVVWESLLNHVWERIGYKGVTKEVVFDAIVYPEGWKKWFVTKGADSEEVDTGESTMSQGDQSGGSMVEMGSSGPAGFPYGQIANVRLAPQQVIVDYNSPDRSLEHARFVAIRYRKLVSELRADPRYKLPKDFKPTTPLQSHSVVGQDREKIVDSWDGLGNSTSAGEYVTIYEVWCYQVIENIDETDKLELYKQVVVLMEESPVPIRGPLPWTDFLGKHVNRYPFNRLVFNPVPDELPASELGTWATMQLSLNQLVSKLTSFVDNDRQLFAVVPSKFKAFRKVKDAFYKGGPKEMFELNDDVDPTTAIFPLSQARASQDTYQLINILQTYIQQVSGIGQNRRGSTGARTATEASLIDRGIQIKTDEKTDTVADFCKRDAEFVRDLLRTTASGSFVFKARGDSGGIKWQRFTEFDASWSPDVRIRVDSFRKATMEERAQGYAQAFAYGVQMFQLYGPKVRLDIVYQRLLETLGVPRPSEVVGSTIPDEIHQMVEIVMMVAGQPTAVAPTDNHQMHAATIADFKNSEAYAALPPEAQQAIDDHEIQHQEAMEQISQQAGQLSTAPSGENLFDDSSAGGTPASEANQATAQDRSFSSQFPSGGGSLA